MDAVDRVLATTSEISLKGENRPWFERHLTRNLRAALSDMPVARVERPSWRVLISFSEPVDFREVARRLVTVFGLHAIMPVQFAGHSMEELESRLAPIIDNMTTTSFAVRCTRSDKRFELTSPEVERRIGSFIQQRTPWPVNLRHPALTVRILIDEHGLYFWTRSVSGPGGMPVGVSGRGACLLSGGIDSPIAAYLMMKRGMRLSFIHFHSVPRTNPASIEKVREIVAVLNRYQASARLALVPLLAIQEEVVARCPAEYRVLLYRRFMLRIADRLAQGLRARALVTGEALGQVASQTIENLAAVESVAALPVLRPLISYDKPEIIALARTVGTYDISIQPHQDCCSFLMSEKPATRSFPSELAEAEDPLDVDGLVEATLDETELVNFEESAAWDRMPAPAFTGL
jgi:thiamine biosynthesis protein ThiI